MYGRVFVCSVCAVLLLAGLVGGCAPAPGAAATPPAWEYPELRAIDAAEAGETTRDLIAAYARQGEGELHIRLDLLEMSELPDYDLYVALDQAAGGSNALPVRGETRLKWDTLLVIRAGGELRVVKAGDLEMGGEGEAGSGLRVRREPRQEMVVVSLAEAAGEDWFGRPGTGVEVLVSAKDEAEVADRIEPFYLSGPPPAPAQARLVFWNTLQASTPLQALRRWDGAHTGPLGGRHGLGNLLRAANRARAPLTIGDVDPTALEAVGGTELVEQMAAEGPLGVARGATEATQQNEGYLQAATSSPEEMNSLSDQGIPVPEAESATRSGPSLTLKRALLAAALAGSDAGREGTPAVLIGGDLAESSWGNPQAARATLEYFANHPWVRLAGTEGIRGDEERETRGGGDGEVVRWEAEGPANCEGDVDRDGEIECVLRSEQVEAIFELDWGGYLRSLRVKDTAGATHQVVGGWEAETGGEEDTERREAVESEMGALTEAGVEEATRAQAVIEDGKLILSVPGRATTRQFSLLEDGLALRVSGVTQGEGYRTDLPLVLDAWLRFEPDWTRFYQSEVDGQTWRWGSAAGPRAAVWSDAEISTTTATEHLDWLRQPEDPNRDIPAGWRLPFPLALATIEADGDFELTIRLSAGR